MGKISAVVDLYYTFHPSDGLIEFRSNNFSRERVGRRVDNWGRFKGKVGEIIERHLRVDGRGPLGPLGSWEEVESFRDYIFERFPEGQEARLPSWSMHGDLAYRGAVLLPQSSYGNIRSLIDHLVDCPTKPKLDLVSGLGLEIDTFHILHEENADDAEIKEYEGEMFSNLWKKRVCTVTDLDPFCFGKIV